MNLDKLLIRMHLPLNRYDYFCRMLSEREEEFISYWDANRLKQKKSFRQFAKGLSSGLSIGIGIVLVVAVGWYQRANMEANSKLNPVVFLLILLIIAIFMAFFYRNYQWEMKEQQYLELLAKKKKTESEKPVQQSDTKKSQ